MEPTTNSNASTKIISALIIGLLVGFFAGVFWQARRAGTAPLEETAATASVTKTETGTKRETGATPQTTTTGLLPAETTLSLGAAPVGNLVVRDQSAAPRVGVASLDVKETVWVVVREEKEGKLGNILGAQKVFVGNGQAVVIELLRPTVAGGTYRVVFYKDVGDPAFNYREDTLVEGVEGRFTAR